MSHFLISKIPRLLAEIIFMLLIVILIFIILKDENSLKTNLTFLLHYQLYQ